MTPEPGHIVVVGGGFSGVALVLQLLRQDRLPLKITLIESGSRLGRGAAYSTEQDCCLLNAPAGRMSIYPDQPMHFVQWLNANRFDATPNTYARRLDYGRYVEESLVTKLNDLPGRHKIHCRLGTSVQDIAPTQNGFRARLDDRSWLDGDVVVLSAGHLPARNPLAPWIRKANERYLTDPRDEARLGTIGANDAVLLVGTGLTMVDVMLTLRGNGHRGVIHAISRRGLLPQGHRPAHRSEPRALPPMMATILGKSIVRDDLSRVLRTIRRLAARAKESGVGWQPVIDYVRDNAPGLWQSLSDSEKRRFLRHLRPHWETHRHRMAPAIAQSLSSELRHGGLRVRPASIVHAADHGSKLRVTLRPRGTTAAFEEYYDRVVRCTEPGSSGPVAFSLFDRLLQRGLLRHDEYRLGLMASRDGLAVGDAGEIPGLYLLGPARRALDWEQTAVPELRNTAAKLAARLVSTLSTSDSSSRSGYSTRRR